MSMVMRVSDKVVAMEFGRKIAEGLPGRGAAGPDGDRGLPRSGDSDALLEVAELRAGYGPVNVLHDVDLAVDDGEIVVVLGANGAGKTTTMRAISGTIARSGTITFDGQSIVDGRRPSASCGAGIAQVPQGRGTFPELSVDDNLRIGAYTRRDGERRRRHRPLVRDVPAAGRAARTSAPAACPAASSRCWPSPGR